MKKFTKIIICIFIIAAIAVTAVACQKKDENGLYILKTPKISFSGNALEWAPSKNAKEYEVHMVDAAGNVEAITVEAAGYVLSIAKKVNVKVRAIGDGIKYTNSGYSSELEFDPIINLTSPDGVTLALMDDKSIKITWNAVAGASNYAVAMTLNGKAVDADSLFSGTETTYAADKFVEAGIYMFTVKAIGDGGKVMNSNPSVSVAYAVTKQLADPSKVVVATTLNSGTISFNKVEYADRYIVRALRDGVEYKQSENVTIGSDIVSIDLSKFSFTDVGIYTFEVKAARKSGASAYYKESAWVKVNLKSDESKLCEMKLYPAPTNLALSQDDKLSWDVVSGAPKYTIEIKSNTNTYTEIVDKPSNAEDIKLTHDLTKNNSLIGTGAENRAGGKVTYMNVYVPENLTEGILKGVATTVNIPYQSSEQPIKDKDGYYEVKNLMHLAYMAKEPNEKYKLVNDINANSSYFFGLNATFSGEFDGNGKTLRNFYIVPAVGADNVSLFGSLAENAVVKNLLIVDSKIDLKNFPYIESKKVNAAFVAINNNGLIDNVTITSTVSTSSSTSPSIATEGAFGGIALINNAKITNCATSFIANAEGLVGGIAAINNGEIFNARVYGSILKVTAIMSVETTSASNNIYNETIAVAGGIAAVNKGTISYSGMQENATVTANANGTNYLAYAGGFVGYMDGGTISNSYVSRQSSSGSINAISATNSSAADYNNNAIAGGFVGVLNKGTIDHCYNHFVGVMAKGTIGGFAGKVFAQGIVNDGYTLTSGKISARVIGGAVGVNQGSFNNFYYGQYETAKVKDIKASAAGNVAGIINVVKGDDMLKLNIEGFMLNDKVIGYMVLSNLPYLDRTFNFRSASISKDTERKNISKVYIGTTIIDAPTVPMSSANTGFGTDKYEIVSGAITYILNRVIQIA